MTYRQTFVVEGTGDFPIDMLRYDTCSPETEADSAFVTSSFVTPNEKRTIRLKRLIANKQLKPTEGRWKSFGWKVDSKSIKTERL